MVAQEQELSWRHISQTYTKPWLRLEAEGEPSVWFARFDRFRLIGPARTFDEAFRRVSGLHRLSAKRPGQAWYLAAERWLWVDRAEAWDEVERSRLQAIEHRRRFDAREQRLRIIGDQIALIEELFGVADLASVSPEQARELLPTLRLFLRDMLAAQRVELGLPLVAGDERSVAVYSSDELALAYRELLVAMNGYGADQD